MKMLFVFVLVLLFFIPPILVGAIASGKHLARSGIAPSLTVQMLVVAFFATVSPIVQTDSGSKLIINILWTISPLFILVMYYDPKRKLVSMGIFSCIFLTYVIVWSFAKGAIQQKAIMMLYMVCAFCTISLITEVWVKHRTDQKFAKQIQHIIEKMRLKKKWSLRQY